MSRPTVISFFSGGGGFDLGARAAGFELAGALERDPRIAEWYELNLNHKPVNKSIEDAVPADFDCIPDWLHASPPCQHYSVARTSAKDAHPDRDAGIEVCRFIRAWKPPFFTLENVVGYSKKGSSLHAIENTLLECGYWVRRLKIDASDYGVPQSRVRLYVIAHRAEEVPAPILPNPSAQKVGWFDAIADLIPTLKETTLAPWQVRKLAEMPAFSSELIANCNTGSAVRRLAHEPAMTMGKSKDAYRPKIYLVNGQDSKTPIRESCRPSATVTVSQAGKGLPKVLSPEIVLATSPRCAARFQTFPDSYQLPKSATLAGALIGNAVPPRIAELIGNSIQQSLNPTKQQCNN